MKEFRRIYSIIQETAEQIVHNNMRKGAKLHDLKEQLGDLYWNSYPIIYSSVNYGRASLGDASIAQVYMYLKLLLVFHGYINGAFLAAIHKYFVTAFYLSIFSFLGNIFQN